MGNALTRTTAYLAIGFFLTSIALTVLATRGSHGGSAFDGAAGTTQQAPAQQEGTGGSALPQLPGSGTGSPQVPVSQ